MIRIWELGVGIWGKRPDRAFLHTGFNHRGHGEGAENTDNFLRFGSFSPIDFTLADYFIVKINVKVKVPVQRFGDLTIQQIYSTVQLFNYSTENQIVKGKIGVKVPV